MQRDYLLNSDGEKPMHVIIAEVATKHGVTYKDILSPRRHRDIIPARFEAYWRCLNETSNSLPQIGRAFGGRDHTAIRYGAMKHEQTLKVAEAA